MLEFFAKRCVYLAKVLVADVGGTKIAVGFSDESGQIQSRTEVKSAAHDAEEMFECLHTAFLDVLEKENCSYEEIEVIALGVPGVVDTANGVAVFQNNLPWRNFPLASRLRSVFPNADVIMDNDVYMAAFGEWNAQMLEKETFAYVTISTGISACILHEGHFIRGAGLAGEIGFSVMEDQDEVRTLESLASGPAMEVEARRVFGDPAMTTKKLIELYEELDPKAAVVVQKSAKYIARGLHQLFTVLDPHVVVVGGGVINNQPQFLKLIQKELEHISNNPIQKGMSSRLKPSHHKGDAGLQGALYCALGGVRHHKWTNH